MADRRRASLARALLAFSVLAPSLASAEGLSAYVEPDYSHTVSRSTDQAGRTASSTTDELAQHYRLMLDRTLFPFVRVDAVGLFERIYDWTDADALSSRSDEWRAGGSAHLRLGPPVLGTDLGYDRRDDSTGTTLASVRHHTVNEIYSAHVGWRPADWPSLDLRVSRTNAYDVDRRLADFTNDEALLSTEYSAFRQLRAGYFVDYQQGTDRVTGTVVSSVTNSGRVTYNDTFDAGRTSVLASYQFNNRVSDTTAPGVGGTVSTPQLPAAGLSLVETFPAVPETDTLAANPALIDGNLTASANVNLGFSVSLGGDTNLRDLGVQFADPTTAVNTLFVWVDRQLPAEIAGAYSWTAYRSDDNVNWTRVNIAGLVAFSAFQNRFEITIDRTQARYLKVVTRPLAIAVTADRRFADVFVTELQPLQVVAAQSVRGSRSTTSHAATGALRRQLFADPMLAYDFSGVLTSGTGGTSYTIQNGVSLDRRLARDFMLTARLARQDTGQSSPGQSGQHSGLFQYSASVVATPLPALTDSVTYTGQYAQTPRGTGVLNAVTWINRAQLYRGIDVLSSAGYSYNLLDTGARARGPTVVATLNLVPNPILSLSTSYYLSSLLQTGGNLPDQRIDSERVDGNVTFNPFPALYFAATVSRITRGVRPTTLATFGGSFSPFPEGALLLRASYSESLDTSAQAKSHSGTTGLRWNFAPRAFLDVSYALLGASADTGSSDTRALNATLVIQL